MLVQKTTNYDQFKGVLGNRKINKPHVNDLISSIEKKNLLQFHPINVNKGMRIIDGQHRLEAARALEVPIFYIVMDEGGIEEIRLLQTQRAWTAMDYLNSYVEQNYPEYIALEDFAKTYQLSVPQAAQVGLLHFTHPQTAMAIFRRGEFRFVDKDRSELFAGYLTELRKYCTDNAYKDREFLVALNKAMDKMSVKQLFHKLDTFSLAITRRTNARDYMRQFEDIYNFKQRAESHLHLT